MNGVQKVIKYFAMAFAIFLAVGIFGTIITVVTGVATGIAGVNRLTGGSERISLSEEYSAEEIKTLGINEIYVDCNAEIVVEQGEVLSIEATDVTEDYEIRCANGKVSVVQDKPAINFVWDWFDNAEIHENVVITVPKEFFAEKIRVNSGSGTVSLSDIKADQLYLDSGSGKVTMESVGTRYLMIDSGSGKVDMIGCYAEETDFNTGSGSVSAEDTALGKLSLNSGSGAVRMRNVITMDAKFDSGSGSISYTGEMTGECEFETGSGALNLSLEGQEDEYLVKAECGSGTFRINGKKVEDGSYGSNVKGKLDIDSGSGSVSVEFNTPAEE